MLKLWRLSSLSSFCSAINELQKGQHKAYPFQWSILIRLLHWLCALRTVESVSYAAVHHFVGEKCYFQHMFKWRLSSLSSFCSPINELQKGQDNASPFQKSILMRLPHWLCALRPVESISYTVVDHLVGEKYDFSTCSNGVCLHFLPSVALSTNSRRARIMHLLSKRVY